MFGAITSNLDAEEVMCLAQIRDWEVFHKLPLKCHCFCSLRLLYTMILYTSTTVDLYPFFIGHYPFPFYPGSLQPFLYSHPIVPSTPYPTTPVSGDRAPIRDSRPRHSRGHEACLSPPYVIHSLLPLTTQSRLTRDRSTLLVHR